MEYPNVSFKKNKMVAVVLNVHSQIFTGDIQLRLILDVKKSNNKIELDQVGEKTLIALRAFKNDISDTVIDSVMFMNDFKFQHFNNATNFTKADFNSEIIITEEEKKFEREIIKKWNNIQLKNSKK